MRTASWSDNVSVLDRLTAILDAFAIADADGAGEGLSVTELARRAGLPKSTASRIATDLTAEGYLDRVGSKLYLGLRFYDLGQSVERPRRLRHAAWRTMAALRDATGHTVRLTVPDGDDVVVIARARGAVDPLPSARIGSRVPRAGTAVGAALEAGPAGPADADSVAATPDGRHVCVAVPVYDGDEAAAALSITHAAGVDATGIAVRLRSAAAAIADELDPLTADD